MSVTILSKVQENVQERKVKHHNFKKSLEERNLDYIKRELRIE